MRTGRPTQPLILAEEERERPESLAHRARRESVLARRARIVLACAEGLDNQDVAKKVRCTTATVASGAPGFWRRGWKASTMSRDPGRRARSATTKSSRW